MLVQVTVTALAMLPEAGLFFTASYDGMVMQWDKAGRGTRYATHDKPGLDDSDQ
jgi:hypothetical protein